MYCCLLLSCAVVVLINITCGQTEKLISNANMFLFRFFPPLAFFFTGTIQMVGNQLASGTEGDLELLKVPLLLQPP